MCLIEFGRGKEVIGRSVFQKLRELRRLHELGWGDEVFRTSNGRVRTYRQRARAINDQKANAVADIAATLGGAGKGNRIWEEGPNGCKSLCPVTVRWGNEFDHMHAKSWPSNVTHERKTPDLWSIAIEAEKERILARLRSVGAVK